MVKKRLVFRLMVGYSPDNDETKNLRLTDLVQRQDYDTREFTGVEPDGDYRLGDVLDDMLAKATAVVQDIPKEKPNRDIPIDNKPDEKPPKVMFVEFTVQDGGYTVGLDLKG